MKFAIDVMGGDHAPQAVLDGCTAFLQQAEYGDATLVLFGEEAILSHYVNEQQAYKTRIETVFTTETIGFDEHPTEAIRTKKDASMVRALQSVKEGAADCIVSAGNSGALLAGATLIIRRQKGVKRPALAALLPACDGGCVLICDCGANTDCKPGYLQQFALMGGAYLSIVQQVQNPRIGLLNNGAEAEKGNLLTKEAYARLQGMDLHFVGNVEARELMRGACDVIVCDGFDGNVLLKTAEGVAKSITDMLKEGLMGSVRGKLGGLMAKPAFAGLKKRMDYTEYGGAPLLGVNGGVIKAHGSSNAHAFYNAIRQAYRLTEGGVVAKIGQVIAETNIED